MQDYDWLPNQPLVWAWSGLKRRIDGARGRRRRRVVSAAEDRHVYTGLLPECRVKPTALETEVNWKGQFSKPPSLILISAPPSVKSGLGSGRIHLHIHLFLSALKKRKKKAGWLACKVSDPEWHRVRPGVLIRLRRHLIRPCRLNRSWKGFGPFPPQACMEWNGKKQYLFEPLSAFKKCFRSIVSLFIYSASLCDLQVNQFVQLFFDAC